jgi:hypothetical protein
MIEHNCEKTILNSKLLSIDENNSKFDVYFALGFKIRNHLQEIPFIKGFPKIPRGCPNFPKILDLILLNFL